jgi:hypothetical protein
VVAEVATWKPAGVSGNVRPKVVHCGSQFSVVLVWQLQ